MYMAKSWKGLLAMFVVTGCAQGLAAPTAYVIDPARTTVTFEVKRLGFSRSGEFTSVAGTVMLDAAANSGSVEIAVDSRSIRAGSEPEENFLRGPGVLNVDEHAEIAYKAGNIVFANGRPLRIEGTLTLRGVTRPVSLNVVGYACPIDLVPGRGRCVLDATAVFKRSEFGMTRYRGFVSDDVKLSIHGVANQVVRRTAHNDVRSCAAVEQCVPAGARGATGMHAHP
jgi:polyisoprenoid-binding protein YceI